MGFGGPHAAFFATKDEFKRNIPGRIIGSSVDSNGNKAYRMALQTREQHIRREKATSNICTAQVLLAVISGMYAVYHGSEGLKAIAERINKFTRLLEVGLLELGYEQKNINYFDTLLMKISSSYQTKKIKQLAIEKEINFRFIDETSIGISINEETDYHDVFEILNIFAEASGNKFSEKREQELSLSIEVGYPSNLKRTSSYLTNDVFNKYHSETEMLRYLKRLENKDLSLVHSMIPLGSCTMKLNATTEMIALTWPEFANIHPFAPSDQTEGYKDLFAGLEKDLAEITGFEAVSLQPNSGAQGEYSGLMVIREYHKKNGNGHRNVAIIPSSAHGTNPASAVMAGMKVVVVNSTPQGNVDVNDLKEKS